MTWMLVPPTGSGYSEEAAADPTGGFGLWGVACAGLACLFVASAVILASILIKRSGKS